MAKATGLMMGDIAVAFVIAIGATVLFIVLPVIYRRYFGPRCPKCRIRPFESIDGALFYDPARDWALYRCDNCGAEFIRDPSGYTPRLDWKGDPGAEDTFQSFDADSQSPTRKSCTPRADIRN